ncbi:MAG: ankyrin repeat domain-containing protein, partial [Myxococcales bacterium]|nr:ankyrin repeat domain-containing protein [Myxococcales bacterium]
MDYREFVPTEADEASVVRALTAWRDIHVAQERTDPLPAGVPELFAAPDAAGAFALGERLVGEHFAMLYAAEADCVPLFRLAMEGHGISRWAAFDRGPDFFLLYACIQGSAGVTRYLLSRGADPRVLHENGPREAFTPLMWAIQGRNQGCVEALLHDPRTDADRI